MKWAARGSNSRRTEYRSQRPSYLIFGKTLVFYFTPDAHTHYIGACDRGARKVNAENSFDNSVHTIHFRFWEWGER